MALFEWDQKKNKANEEKHGLSFGSVEDHIRQASNEKRDK